MRHAIVHDPDYVAPLAAGHRFPMSKYEAVMDALAALGASEWAEFHAPEPASHALLSATHAPAYVDQAFALAVDPAIERRIGFPVTERVLRRARLATGGTLLAARLALERGFASNAAGGSHHAQWRGGSGYCVFNDVAVVARELLRHGEVERLLVVDLDVHQGDGTAELLADEPRAFTFSMHCEANFPVRKIAGDLDIGLPAGTGDGDYLAILGDALPGLIDHHAPQLIFYNAGVDPHEADRLGRLALTDDGLWRRDTLVTELARRRGVPLVSVMGGGYGANVSDVARRHARTIQAVARAGQSLA